MKKLVYILFFQYLFAQSIINFDLNESFISYDGKHPAHNWTGISKDIQGTFEINKQDLTQSKVDLFVPVFSFDSKNANRDSNMLDVVEEYYYPFVRFTSSKINKSESGFDVLGDLSFHGITKEFTIPVELNEDNENIIVCSLKTAQSLFGLKENMFSEIYLASENSAKIKSILKSRFNSLSVKTHEELNETLYKMMQSEKLIVSIIMIMIVLVSVFNVIGAVIMLIVEKEFDLKTFKVLGMSNKAVENVFFKNGLFINFIGLALGLCLSVVLVFAQMKFSIVKISSLELAYPVAFNLNNLLLVVFTALFVGFTSSYISSKAVRKLI